MNTDVQDLLSQAERERGVKILFAVESGSRAWGLDSPKSDCDVRFVFVYPRDRYLSLVPPNDVIVRKNGEIELDSWELRKALGLLSKGNPTCMEWVYADVVYRELGWEHWPGLKVLRELGVYYFNPIASYHHYLHIASNNYKDYIKGKVEVPVKKLTHVFRGLFSALWVETHNTRPPHKFDDLMSSGAPSVRNSVGHLAVQELALIVAMKRIGQVDWVAEPAWLEPFLDRELARMRERAASIPKPLNQDYGLLDEFFRASLR